MKLLKYFLCLIGISMIYGEADGVHEQVLALPKEVSAVVKEVVAGCAKNVDIDELYTLILAGKYKEDDDFKKLVHCAYLKTGFARQDGSLDPEAAALVFPNNKELMQSIQNCNKKGATPLETNWLSFKCFMDTSQIRIQL